MQMEKEGLEQGAIEKFAEAFTCLFGRGCLEFVKLMSPPNPDGFCRFNGADLLIEVAHIYGNNADARRLLQRGGTASPTNDERMRSAMIPLDARVIPPLNRVLAAKALKTYAGCPIWLLIRVALPLLTIEDFTGYSAQIVIPPQHPFDEIWLMCGPTEQFGIMSLYVRA